MVTTAVALEGAALTARSGKNLPEMQETRLRFVGQEDLLEREMATHSSILAWRIPWPEERGGLQSTGSQRIGHNLATKPPWPQKGFSGSSEGKESSRNTGELGSPQSLGPGALPGLSVWGRTTLC